MFGTHLSIVGSILVRVLPVTQPRDPLVAHRAVLRKAFGLPFNLFTEPVRDRGVVLGGPPERRERQTAAGLLWDLPLAFEGLQYLFVELGRGNYSHGPEVLGGGPQHGGSSDVYLFYCLLLWGAAGD